MNEYILTDEISGNEILVDLSAIDAADLADRISKEYEDAPIGVIQTIDSLAEALVAGDRQAANDYAAALSLRVEKVSEADEA